MYIKRCWAKPICFASTYTNTPNTKIVIGIPVANNGWCCGRRCRMRIDGARIWIAIA